MTRRTRVYVAGPIEGEGAGKLLENIHRALEVGSTLIERGYAPYVPALTALWQIVHPHRREEWLALDREYLPICDVLLRLDGTSSGANDEVALATSSGIPVTTSLDLLVAMYPAEHPVEGPRPVKDPTKQTGQPVCNWCGEPIHSTEAGWQHTSGFWYCEIRTRAADGTFTKPVSHLAEPWR